MIEVRLSTESILRPIALFDGHILEFFFDELNGGSRRVHIAHIKSIEIMPVSRGREKYSLQVHCEYQIVAVDVNEAALPKARELVIQVKQAMASLKL
jgi:chemotaxis methyl-accepting protein methylase